MIKLRNVCIYYEKDTAFETRALNDVSLSIEAGSFLGITGRTGSGKSTLLRLLGSLVKPDSGNADIGLSVGLVMQFPEHQLFEETVLKDVMFGPRNLGLPDTEDRAVSALEMVGLDESFHDRSPFELSGGEQRRVAIAGVLAMGTDAIVLDEPTSGLDRAGHDQVMALLRKLNGEGRTIVVVSHDLDDILAFCDRVVLLSEGSIAYCGSPVGLVEGHPELATERFRLVEGLRKAGFDVDHFMDVETLAKAIASQLG